MLPSPSINPQILVLSYLIQEVHKSWGALNPLILCILRIFRILFWGSPGVTSVLWCWEAEEFHTPTMNISAVLWSRVGAALQRATFISSCPWMLNPSCVRHPFKKNKLQICNYRSCRLHYRISSALVGCLFYDDWQVFSSLEILQFKNSFPRR